MTLRKKTLLVITSILFMAWVAIYLVLRVFVLGGLGRLENQQVLHDLSIVVDLLGHNLADLGAQTRDWAAGHGTYQFMGDGDPAYVSSNLADQTFVNLHLSLMAFVDPTGHQVYAKAFDLGMQQETGVPQSLQQHLAAGSPLLEASEQPVTGVILLAEGPMMVGAEPILTSENQGPSRGVLIFGRYLDDLEIGRLTELMHASTSLYRLDGVLPPDVQAVRQTLVTDGRSVVRPLSAVSMAGYALVSDVYGQPSMVFRIDHPRDIYLQGQGIARDLMMALLAVSVVLGMAILWLLERSVLSRLSRLASTVRSIGTTRDLSARVSMVGSDEISKLADATNDMLSAVERSENELRQSEERFKDISHSVADMIWEIDSTGAITYCSDKVHDILGYSSGEMIGKNVHDLALSDPAGQSGAMLSDMFASKKRIRDVETFVLRKDGQQVCMLVDAVPVLDQQGNLKGYRGVHKDITERKRAQAELEQLYWEAENARGEIHAILDASSDAMLVVAPDGRFLTANRRVLELFAVEPQQLVGHHYSEWKTYLERVFTDASMLLEGSAFEIKDAEREFTDTVLQRWPQERELQVLSTPVRLAQGEYAGRLFAFHDATREREADRLKNEFVSLVSHELRTPLTSIKGYVDLLHEGMVGDLTEEQREFLGIVKSNTDRLAKLINDLLDISRIEAGKIELRKTSIDLAALASQVAELFQPQLHAKNQQLTLDVAQDLPAAWGDPDRIIQILSNLLSNAHKYTPPGGSMVIAVRSEDGVLRVDVKDSGIGLSPEEQALVFTKFFRADNRVTREAGGTGLGLAITRSLVQMHGGDITVESAPGAGSTFSFTLPKADVAPVPERVGEPISTGGRVLIVEDEPDIANLIRRYLERAGYQVLVAPDAAEGLRIAKDEQPDLITVAIAMPGTDGFTLLEWLKGTQATASIPVIMVSILPDDGRGQLLGAVDYLTKPVEEQALLQRVARVLASNQAKLVLVVDDDPDTRRLLSEHLQRAGYDVVEAGDGAQALDLARKRRPGLLLMDIKMPGMDGVAALQALRSDKHTQDLAVVMMTSYPMLAEESRSMLEALGYSGLLSKPFTGEELAATIGRALANR